MITLDRDTIQNALEDDAAQTLRYLTVLDQTDSTNSAINRLPEDFRHAHAILAESQTSGRGRRQRQWHSPQGGNLYLSMGWAFETNTPALASLPLVVAVSICRSLDAVGLSSHGIKWPNDIQIADKKLAGVLVEMQSSGQGPVWGVIGIGLNVVMPNPGLDADQAIDRPWTDLNSELGPDTPNRNLLAAGLISELTRCLLQFGQEGLTPFHREWGIRDILLDKPVRVEQSGEWVRGVAAGINTDGALQLVTENGKQVTLHSGEVSVRHG